MQDSLSHLVKDFHALPFPEGVDRRSLYHSSYRAICTYAMPITELDTVFRRCLSKSQGIVKDDRRRNLEGHREIHPLSFGTCPELTGSCSCWQSTCRCQTRRLCMCSWTTAARTRRSCSSSTGWTFTESCCVAGVLASHPYQTSKHETLLGAVSRSWRSWPRLRSPRPARRSPRADACAKTLPLTRTA